MRRAVAPLLALALLAPGGCEPPPRGAAARPAPELRLAGADLLYALRRVASGADLVLCVDEIMGADLSPELSLLPVDLDLAAGAVRGQLRALQRHTAAFDFRFREDVLYVRSRGVDDATASLDAALLEAGVFEGTLEQLAAELMERHPRALLSIARIPGEPLFRSVRLDIPAGASVIDVLIDYADAARHGWVMRRAGYRAPEHDAADGSEAYMLSSLELRGPLHEPVRLRSLWRRDRTLLHSLAHASRRLDVPLLIVDEVARGDIRGRLYGRWLPDPRLEQIGPTLDAMARVRGQPLFEHRVVDGVAVLRAASPGPEHPGVRLLGRTLEGGSFEGSLGELARWIHARLPDDEPARLMAGEIRAAAPRARLEIPDGSSVEEVLRRFAAASRVGVNVVLYRGAPHPRTWRGAYLQSLDEFVETPGAATPAAVPREPG